ncbi:MAG TPA: NAD(P)/FAD-dependent oxidoreductase [Pyrinomonadaceae bacterium]|jgi:predicted Rossmann fold flavoprotein|nr:NAD(P)/FAD-dependent oxidoreductase [Pyrinomonadaceae bacterium]
MKKDVVIIGAGAAGLFCAVEAGKRGRSVVVLEHAGSVGKKIAISGGGRCNFTNLYTTHENFLSANPNFARSALARYTPADFVALVERHRIPFHEKKLGQLFCDVSARRINEMLLDECERAGVEIRLNCQVSDVSKDDSFNIQTNQGAFTCASLVVATGGLSIPKIGATDFGYRLARRFNLKIQTPRPALVPLTLSPADLDAFQPLSGVSVPAVAACDGARFEENILITHRGLSGPAILQISSYWTRGQSIRLNLLPDTDIRTELRAARDTNLELSTLLSRHLPKRFAQTWCDLYAPSRPLKQYSPRQLEEIAARLHDWHVMPSGTEGFNKAEVTLGGIDTSELSSKTMEANKVPGLHFIGEVVDVTGHLGGHNFQWAWASAYAAGQYV